jgi:NAD-dependent dihydropyrimidine dehydrogenase PreA subunit
MAEGRILYCHCAYAKVIPEDVKNEVLELLGASGRPFEAVADLCRMAADRDPALGKLAGGEGDLRIAACFPRAVKWLFHAAGFPLPEERVEIRNMRVESAADVVAALLGADEETPAAGSEPGKLASEVVEELLAETGSRADGAPKPWFPVVDYDRCTHCLQCLNFCLFGVFGVDGNSSLRVENPWQCKTDCPACARVCPEVAIIFPQYGASPINGGDVDAAAAARDRVKVDVSALLGGDVHQALRQRQECACRFSKDRDEKEALRERLRHIRELGGELDIPPEVLMALPSMDEIQARAQAARRRAEEAREESEKGKRTGTGKGECQCECRGNEGDGS